MPSTDLVCSGVSRKKGRRYLPRPVWCKRAEMLKIMFLHTSVMGVFTTLLLFSRHRYLWKVSQALLVTDPSPEPPTVKMSSDLQKGMRTSYQEMRTENCPYGGFPGHQLERTYKNPKCFFDCWGENIRLIQLREKLPILKYSCQKKFRCILYSWWLLKCHF